MNKLLGIVAVLAFLGPSLNTMGSSTTFVLPACLQDQYGDQYDNLVVDSVHGLVSGVVNLNPLNPCSSEQWSMIGSWMVNANGQTILELTASSAPGVSQCVSMYTLKGPYPQSSWNYVGGYGRQGFHYVGCSANSAVLRDTGVGGVYGLK